MNYKLLTPGPLTTSKSVRAVMQVDHCTWDDDYKIITQNIRKDLVCLAKADDNYTAVLMQGSGTFGVESVVNSAVGENGKLLVIANGEYGKRIAQIASYANIPHILYETSYDEQPNTAEVDKILTDNSDITHVAIVHCETTSGMLNDIESVSKVVKKHNKTYIVDAMSSFGGIEIDMIALDIDYLISSANKCIQGVPGFSFAICKKSELVQCKGNSKSLSLDLYDQWIGMDKDGKWRFTSPTHVVLAFSRALEELEIEGGIPKRYARFRKNNDTLIEKMSELGIKSYVKSKHQSPIITTFFMPCGTDFFDMYNFVKQRGYAIYPGKLTKADTFRIGNIGEIYSDDIEKLCEIFKEYFNKK